jgi:ribosomal protein S18 acetylase RimI-like enzyme
VTTKETTPDRIGLEPPLPLPPEPVHLASPFAPIAYFKRFKMEADLSDVSLKELPPGFSWMPWSLALLDAHAEVLFASFQGEIDAVVFPSLGDLMGCRTLMSSIALKSGFVPEATWLLMAADGPCGSIQGIRERRGLGSIQNIGIVPRHRGRGLGSLLLRQAMAGFRAAGLTRAGLEVTAQNERAERIYRRLGFRRVKTLYKAVHVARHQEPATTARDLAVDIPIW